MNQLQKILLIDDEMILRNGIKYLCNWEAHGFTIVGEASNGIEGFRLVEQLKPDIVITDIVMPGSDGIELTAKIKEHYPNISVIILSNYNNFSYAKSGFKLGIADYLLKPEIDENTLLNLLNQLGHTDASTNHISSSFQYLQELLAFGCTDNERCRNELKKRGVRLNESPFILLLSSCPDFTDIDFLPTITRICLEILPDVPFVCCNTMQGELALLLQLSTHTENFTEELSLLFERLCMQPEFPSFFACSTPFSNLEELSGKYKQLRKLLPFCFYFPDHHLIFPDWVIYADLPFPEKDFNTSLHELDLPGIRRLLDSYIYDQPGKEKNDVYLMKKQLENHLYILIQYLTETGYPTTEINSNKLIYFKQIDLSTNIRELSCILDRLFSLLVHTLEKATIEKENDLFHRLEKYILDNCEQDLKLYKLAKQFHMNYTYLSTLFYQNTKEHFPDYLNRIRIEKAKMLLCAGNLPIQSIALQCGFENQGYFSKIFKKRTGYTPKEYRKKKRSASSLSSSKLTISEDLYK